MDRPEHPEQALLTHVVGAMKPLGLQLEVLRPRMRSGAHLVDARIDVRFGAHRLRYVAQVKRCLRPETLGAVVHQLRALGGTPLLVTVYLTPLLADALRARGVESIDTAGNVFLNRPHGSLLRSAHKIMHVSPLLGGWLSA